MSAVNLTKRVIEIRESWDPKEGAIEPKTRESRRTVPVPSVLRELLLDLRSRQGQSHPDALAFGVAKGEPFVAERLYRHADYAWRHAALRSACGSTKHAHTYASFMIAAGVNPKALSSFMGHSSITVTFDLYGDLMPGTEAEATNRLDAFLRCQVDNDGVDFYRRRTDSLLAS